MKILLSLITIATLTIPALADSSTSKVDSVGKQIFGVWKLDFTTPDDVHRTPMVLIGRQHHEFVAWYVEKDKPEPFKKVVLDDDTLVLTIRPRERKDVLVKFKARLQGKNVCAGEATYVMDDGDAGSWDFKGKRYSDSDFDGTAKWQLSFVTPNDQRQEATVTVVESNDQLYGWYSSKNFELPAKKLTKDGNKVVMALTAKTKDGANIDVTFRGKTDADRVSGEVEYDLEGDTGSFPFKGQRKS